MQITAGLLHNDIAAPGLDRNVAAARQNLHVTSAAVCVYIVAGGADENIAATGAQKDVSSDPSSTDALRASDAGCGTVDIIETKTAAQRLCSYASGNTGYFNVATARVGFHHFEIARYIHRHVCRTGIAVPRLIYSEQRRGILVVFCIQTQHLEHLAGLFSGKGSYLATYRICQSGAIAPMDHN